MTDTFKLGGGFIGALRIGVSDAFRKWLYTAPVAVRTLTPLAASAANVSASAATPTVLVLAAGAGATSAVLGGVAYVKPDVPRGLTITSGGDDTGKTARVTGLNIDAQPQTELVALGNAVAVTGRKTWSAVASIALSAAAAGTVEAGFADLFPLVVAIDTPAQLLSVSWGGSLARDTGTVVVADRTTPATASTGDIRGTYAPSTASNGARVLGYVVAGNSEGYSEKAVSTALYGVQPK